MKVSFAITVCNELEEIKRLVPFLFEHKRKEDEIVILYDEKNGNPEVLDFLLPYNKYPNVQTWRGFDFEGNFADWKNLLNSYCKGDYIVSIDADEMISEYMVKNLYQILEMNPMVDLYFMSRINTVSGIGLSHVDKWGWNITKNQNFITDKEFDLDNPNDLDEYNLLIKYNLIIEEKKIKIKFFTPIINMPDQQGRIYRKGMSWYGKVHERIYGGQKFSSLPLDEEYCIQHHKTIERQEKQNNYYSTL